MGFFSPDGESHVESIVFFLSEALRAAIEAGDGLQQSTLEAPQFAPDMECSEIADRLAHFRQHVSKLWSLELGMLAKILRAQDLAKELRMHEPILRPEIDTFRLATVMAADLRDLLLPTKEAMFDGTAQPKRFLEARGHVDPGGAGPRDALLGYKIAGQLDVRLLIDACMALHFSLSARYGVNAPVLLPRRADAVATELEPEIALLGEGEEEPFLLSDWAEIVSDAPAASPLTH
jgi:hypothetical protein